MHLATRRWAHVPQALTAQITADVLQVAPAERIAEQSPPGSSVAFASLVAGATVTKSPSLIQDMAAGVRLALGEGSASGIEVPAFTDVTWNWYAHDGHISLHRDPPMVGGVIAIFTLAGSASFTIHERVGFRVTPGDLVLLAANRWPSATDACPLHAAGTPEGQERIILTLRHNLAGPGRDFFGG